jgi:hypothetical protein
MSKFLDLIEENTPDLNLDEKIAAKRAVQRCLMEKDIKCDADQKSDDVMIHLPDGRIVKLEVKEFVEVEDAETMKPELTQQGDKAAELALAMGAATDVVGKVDPKAGMFARDGAKKLAKVTNQVYLQVANDLKKSLKAIKKG